MGIKRPWAFRVVVSIEAQGQSFWNIGKMGVTGRGDGLCLGGAAVVDYDVLGFLVKMAKQGV